ncbi:MAG: hypothetical protein WCT31_02665 [Candidatus Micrarchaeia archaeon]|jgi:dolichol kinase
MEKKTIGREIGRQLLHALVGIFLILFLAFFGRERLVILLSATLLVGMLMINWKMLGSRVPVADWFQKRFERDATRFPGYGSAWYVVGALMLAIFLHDISQISAGIFILAVGDAASTLVGMHGSYKLPYNKHKTIEGSLAFILFSLPAYAFIGWIAIPLAVAAAIAESIPLPYDDNVVIPAVCVVFFLLV